jgi:hypothetical protein
MSEVSKSRLLHFHTHCNWSFDDPLDHHLTFPRLTSIPEQKLTAKEVFDIRLLPGTHVNMIACQGGLAAVRAGDEVMGLVPALLYSGASSTVSTLWNIADPDGARFSRLFFKSFREQCQENWELSEEEPGTPCFVDVAIALQDAVKAMDPHGHEALYSWAGFVLHGFWEFPVSAGDAKRFKSDD